MAKKQYHLMVQKSLMVYYYNRCLNTYPLLSCLSDNREEMCYTDWITLFDDDDDERIAAAFIADTKHLWPKKEIQVFFMNKIPPWENDKDGYISKEEILEIANEWHECGPDVVPKFVECTTRELSNIRVMFIGKLQNLEKIFIRLLIPIILQITASLLFLVCSTVSIVFTVNLLCFKIRVKVLEIQDQ